MDDQKIKFLLTKGRKMQAIKFIISETGCGLKRAKDYIEKLHRSSLSTDENIRGREISDMEGQPQKSILQQNVADKARQIILHGKKVDAITFLHQNTEMSLQEAKRYVDKQDRVNLIDDKFGEASGEGLSKASLDAKACELLAADKKVAAIKLVHIATGMSLKEAHEYINKLPMCQWGRW